MRGRVHEVHCRKRMLSELMKGKYLALKRTAEGRKG